MSKVIHGDCIEVMRTLPGNSVDSIVTDPPYGLGFMGKAWDTLPPGFEWASECLRVLKPGGHLLAFGGTRTWHRLALSIEDAGFEIRDSIAWLYGQGFPKHRANLKPAFEPIIMARKPFKGSLTKNEEAHGTGSLRTDDVRTAEGRWPANVTLDEFSADALDEQAGKRRSSGNIAVSVGAEGTGTIGPTGLVRGVADPGVNTYNDQGGAARFFYVPKASNSERPKINGITHPTVKPLELMRWLVRLVTPAGGTVLEPFAGSGATVEACVLEGLHCIAIEQEAEYLPLIQARIARQDGA